MFSQSKFAKKCCKIDFEWGFEQTEHVKKEAPCDFTKGGPPKQCA